MLSVSIFNPAPWIPLSTYASLLAVGTPVLDNDARAVDNLASIALTVENAYSTVRPIQTPQIMCRDHSQRPAHSPNCLPSGTLIRGILCSEQRAMTSFL